MPHRLGRILLGSLTVSFAACTEPRAGLVGSWRYEDRNTELSFDTGRQYILMTRDGEYYSGNIGSYHVSGDSIVFHPLIAVNKNAALGGEKRSYFDPPVSHYSNGFELRGDTLVLRYTGEFLGERFPVTKRLLRQSFTPIEKK